MQPFVHLSVGYLCVAVYSRWDDGRPPADAPVAVAVTGAALPDLIDKPLWLAGVVPVGRTIGHSVLFAIPLLVVGWRIATRRRRSPLAVAFAIGYLSHLATDVPWHLVSGDYHELQFLLWPVTQTPPYTGTKPLGTLADLRVTTLWLEAVVFVAGIALWWHDGKPGLRHS